LEKPQSRATNKTIYKYHRYHFVLNRSHPQGDDTTEFYRKMQVNYIFIFLAIMMDVSVYLSTLPDIIYIIKNAYFYLFSTYI